MSAGRWRKTLVFGLIAAAAGFAEISFWSSRTHNGLVVECDYTNLSPWIFGPIALVAGIVTLWRARAAVGPASGRDRNLGLVCVTLGVVHLLRAIEVVELVTSSPC